MSEPNIYRATVSDGDCCITEGAAHTPVELAEPVRSDRIMRRCDLGPKRKVVR